MLELGDRATFQRAGERTDPYSLTAVRDDWANPQRMLVAPVGVEPITAAESTQVGRAAVRTRLRLYLAGVVHIDPAWRVLLRGRAWQVVSGPSQWRHPGTGWEAGTTVEVEAVDG